MFETDLDAVLFSGASEDVNFLDFLADEQLCGGSDEVVAKGLGHERERPTDGCTHGIIFLQPERRTPKVSTCRERPRASGQGSTNPKMR